MSSLGLKSGVSDIDFSQLASVLGAVISKGGPPAIILALFIGAAALVREIRGGKISSEKEADLIARLGRMQVQLDTLQSKFDGLEAELESAYNTIHAMRYQRDQARIQAERLGYDPTLWPPDPAQPGGVLPAPPAAPTVILPPLPDPPEVGK